MFVDAGTETEPDKIDTASSTVVAATPDPVPVRSQQGKDTADQLAVMNKSLMLLWAEVKNLTDYRSHRPNGTAVMEEEQHSPSFLPFITSEEELTCFEDQLHEKTYFLKIHKTLVDRLESETDVKSRMHSAFQILFDKKFVVQCSWRGGGKSGPKIRLDEKGNVLRLFKAIGEDVGFVVGEEDVKKFFVTKLNNAQSSANNFKGVIKSSSKCYHKREKNVNK
ncbi:uncharacterized protein LOC128306747 [Anopheles moucheti]|uniref:uncharacterized protein LOC128306747 n=1 Tax=Anopheles moucheti TaxID=186751 RepID=UPI0022F019FE|nr:uncharacterized protein LOC128306747 [Anopheles moucheti]